jgi:pimeloyl-ACP methyl ester carboxylesterase
MVPSDLPRTYIDYPNLKISVNGVSMTYRDVGKKEGIPIVLLNHWGATLDFFDPLIVDNLAKHHRVIATNYQGIGNSEGKIKTDIRSMSKDFIALLDALKINQAHLLGFSLGGFVAQDVTSLIPERVLSLTLAGTGPAGGYKIGGWALLTWYGLIFKSIFLLQDPRRYLFFPPTADGKKNAYDFITRVTQRKKDLDGSMSLYAMFLQAIAITKWGNQKPQELSAYFKMPVLVVNGDNDLMVSTSNSVRISKNVSHSKLVLYNKAGHGGIFQYANQFSTDVSDMISRV